MRRARLISLECMLSSEAVSLGIVDMREVITAISLQQGLASEVACLWDGETGGGSSEASPQDQSLPEEGGTEVRWVR